MLSYSQLIKEAEQGRVTNASIADDELTGHLSDGKEFTTILPPQQETVVDLLVERGADVMYLRDESNPLLSIMLSWLPFAIFIGVMAYYLGKIAHAVRLGTEQLDALLNRVGQLKVEGQA
jgi:cell division protease FtsH